MPRFDIVPMGQPATRQLAALDGAGVLRLIYGLECGQAEVFEDGAYVFSIDTWANGMWSIYQRDLPRAPEFELFG